MNNHIKKIRRVLFLCTGNSCRSQMAEGLVNHYLSDTWEAYSAGTKPSGYVHPMAIQAMAELGIDIAKRDPNPPKNSVTLSLTGSSPFAIRLHKTARHGWARAS